MQVYICINNIFYRWMLPIFLIKSWERLVFISTRVLYQKILWTARMKVLFKFVWVASACNQFHSLVVLQPAFAPSQNHRCWGYPYIIFYFHLFYNFFLNVYLWIVFVDFMFLIRIDSFYIICLHFYILLIAIYL